MFHRLARILRFTQLAALLILALMGAALYYCLTDFERASEWVDHTHEVIQQIEQTRLNTMRSGIWLRNYALAPASSSLERMRSSAAGAEVAARRVEALTRDDPGQHRLAQALVGEVRHLLAIYLEAANLAERQGLEALPPVILAYVREDVTRPVRERLDALEKVEQQLLHARSEVQKRHFERVKQLLFGTVLVVAIALLWSIRYSDRLLRLDRQAVARLAAQAAADPLTGLLNRRELEQQLGLLVQQTVPGGGQAAVMAFDLDDFKPVNDHYGHAAGDAVLKAVGERLQQQCRERDLVARLGGDEFVVVLHSVASRNAAAAIAERMRRTLLAPVDIGGVRVCVGASIGLAMVPADGRDMDSLLKAADAGLYRAKHAGKGGVDSGFPEAA
ncbi:sensor domain-containing diguanylate cyclase [Caldimonas tepidiphila]|uniref:GGDEF domain-containing protein n=1 Tax=Caldimonas tepidiphila TaxID=2315841 RepID=UPI000E5AF704|nr:diguanylate cyclase [Caldimonas tepidiphila]